MESAGRRGRTIIVATRQRKWSKTVETVFLDALRHSGNITAATRGGSLADGSPKAGPGMRKAA